MYICIYIYRCLYIKIYIYYIYIYYIYKQMVNFLIPPDLQRSATLKAAQRRWGIRDTQQAPSFRRTLGVSPKPMGIHHENMWDLLGSIGDQTLGHILSWDTCWFQHETMVISRKLGIWPTQSSTFNKMRKHRRKFTSPSFWDLCHQLFETILKPRKMGKALIDGCWLQA